LSDVNQVGNFGNQPIHVACARSAPEEVMALVSGGADPNAIGEHGNTPLHEAVGQDSLEIVALLLQLGANSSIRNDFSQTPADIASLMGRDKLIEALQSSGGA